jgi:hypothetical protein
MWSIFISPSHLLPGNCPPRHGIVSPGIMIIIMISHNNLIKIKDTWKACRFNSNSFKHPVEELCHSGNSLLYERKLRKSYI